MSNQAVLKTKPKRSKPPINQYTVGEEIFNSVSHGVGALLAVIGGSVVVTLAAVYGHAREVLSCLVYAISLFVLYTMSTLYHAFPFKRVKQIFRVFDHSSVFLLIAGTYTPFMMITLRGTTKGLVIITLVWAAALLGIVLNAFSVNRFAKLSLVLYLLMGWCVIFAIGDVARLLATGGVVLLLAGGASYTIGVAFYLAKKVRYMHAVWHLFVLLGSILHYLCIVIYVIPHG